MSRLNKIFHCSSTTNPTTTVPTSEAETQNKESGIIDSAVQYVIEQQNEAASATAENTTATGTNDDKLVINVEKIDAETIENLFKKIPLLPSLSSKLLPAIAKLYVREIVSQICNATHKTTTTTLAKGVTAIVPESLSKQIVVEIPSGNEADVSANTKQTQSANAPQATQAPATTFLGAPVEPALLHA